MLSNCFINLNCKDIFETIWHSWIFILLIFCYFISGSLWKWTLCPRHERYVLCCVRCLVLRGNFDRAHNFRRQRAWLAMRSTPEIMSDKNLSIFVRNFYLQNLTYNVGCGNKSAILQVSRLSLIVNKIHIFTRLVTRENSQTPKSNKINIF